MDASQTGPALRRQHLIDPEICIRCNTCEEICPSKAISHDKRSYAVDFDKCNFGGDCLAPCPTGAIAAYRQVARPWSLAEQFGFESLPPDAGPAEAPSSPDSLPDEVTRLAAVAVSGAGGQALPPWSAAHPYINLYAPDRPIVATVAGNLKLTGDGASSDIHHIVVDLGTTAFPLLEGQSVGVIAPGLDENGKPHRVRLYSVASPREGERAGYNNLALTVKRVTEDRAGKPVKGVCSNYLCDLKKGDAIRLAGPYGMNFLMPNHPGAHIAMICTGTGSAPMRAMTERRRRKWARGDTGAAGKLMLFFGARTPGELPYFGPLMKLPKEFIDIELAFSRDPARPKAYVQDRLRARAESIGALLQNPDAFFYLCGHKKMEDGVGEAFAAICRGIGRDWNELRGELLRAGRYHVETY